MSVVIAREHELYTTVADGIDRYVQHSPGEQYVSIFQDMAGIASGTRHRFSVLDAGCCSGKGGAMLARSGFEDVRLCDLTDAMLVDEARGLPFAKACLWQPLQPQLGYLLGGQVDYVFCCDVLEHIPTEFTMLTVARLLEIARRGVFLSISLVPDGFGVLVGEHLHKTVQPFTWWRDNLDAVGLGTVTECRDLLHTGLYFMEPRR